MNENFHKLAKEAGNRLSNYIMTYASGAVGLFFLSLMQSSLPNLDKGQKLMMLSSLLLYSLTVLARLLELHIDAKRFYATAKENEKPESDQDWHVVEQYKKARLNLIYLSYVSIAAATICALFFMVMRIFN